LELRQLELGELELGELEQRLLGAVKRLTLEGIKMSSFRNFIQLVLSVALILGLLAPASAPGAAQAANLHPLLAQLAVESPAQTVAVIVQKATKDARAEDLVAALDGKVINDLHIINAFSAEMTAGAALKLAASPSVRWVSLDGAVRSTAASDPTVRDEFSTTSYSNNNGSQSWADKWTESGDDNEASSGYVKISSGRLQLSKSNRSLKRSASLSGVASATLSFQYKRSGLDDSSDYVAVEISANGGSTWTRLARYAGSGSDSAWQTASFDITAHAATNTAIRFLTSSSLGSYDYLYVDNVQIEYALPPAVALESSETSDSTSQPVNYFLDTLRVRDVWGIGLKGKGIGIAVIDSGIAADSDFGTAQGTRLVQVSVNPTASNGDDVYGHGTHVAGIIGGSGADSGGEYAGIAPEATLIGVRISDDTGRANESDVVAAMQWVLDHQTQYNIRVVNLSINSSVEQSYHSSPLSAAVEILWFNRIVVVASAGNRTWQDSYNPVNTAPANDPFVITVGASMETGAWLSFLDDYEAPFSAHGLTTDGFTKPDILAPGTGIISVLAPKSPWAAQYAYRVVGGGQYIRLSGTSMSTPLVTGAVALLLQDEPNLTPDQVKYRLTHSSRTVKGWDGEKEVTYPYLDVYAAVTGTSTESANVGLPINSLLFTGSDPVTWTAVNWNAVNWNAVNWNAVNWNAVNWNAVNWNGISWDN
jgi:serine protease AprX